MGSQKQLMKGAEDAIPAGTNPGVVNTLGCTDCSAVYIVKTARSAKKRMEEHQCHTKRGEAEMSAIAHHVVSMEHKIHWKPKILLQERHATRRKVRESLIINRLGDTNMNQDRGKHLSDLWLDLTRS